MQNWGNTVSEAPRQYFGSARGTKSSPSALQNGDNIGITFYQDIADAPALLNTAKYAVIVKKDTTFNGLPTGTMWFNPGENDTPTSALVASSYTRMIVNRTGVGIGAPIYPKATLHLNGTFRAEGLGSSTSTTELLGRDANKDVFPISIGSGLSLTSGVLSATKSYFYVTASDTIAAGNTLKAVKNLNSVKLQGWHVQADSILVCDVAGEWEMNVTPYLSREFPSNGTIEFRVDKNNSGIASSTCYQSTEMIGIKAPCPVTFTHTFAVNDQLKFKSTAQGTEDTYITINCTSHKVN